MSFRTLRATLSTNSPTFCPFFMLGDPTPDRSLDILRAAIDGGARMLELGLPYSDAVADGPSVQKAIGRARESGTTVDIAFDIMRRLRRETNIPFNLLVYGNLVHARGARDFAVEATESGASSLLVPDVPLEEGAGLRDACHVADLGFVQLASVATPPERLRDLSTDASAFIYLAGRQGTTGASDDDSLPTRLRDHVRRASTASSLPVAVGFGLKSPCHLEQVFAAGACVAIVGSALCDVIEQSESHDVVANTEAAVRDLVGAERFADVEPVKPFDGIVRPSAPS